MLDADRPSHHRNSPQITRMDTDSIAVIAGLHRKEHKGRPSRRPQSHRIRESAARGLKDVRLRGSTLPTGANLKGRQGCLPHNHCRSWFGVEETPGQSIDDVDGKTCRFDRLLVGHEPLFRLSVVHDHLPVVHALPSAVREIRCQGLPPRRFTSPLISDFTAAIRFFLNDQVVIMPRTVSESAPPIR